MIYDNFTEEQICGLYTPWHFVAIAIFFILAVVLLFFSRKLNEKQTKIILWVIAVLVLVMEIIKIAIRIYRGDGYDSYIPLYFCSLFIYAIWLSLCKSKHLKTCGYCFMVFGGIPASVCFIFYPSTSLMIYPIWHLGSLHSLFYHFLMFYSGCLILLKNLYTPQLKDAIYYIIFVTFFSVIAIIVNHFLGTNMMFMGNPFGLPFLDAIFNYSKVLYIILVYLAQGVALFFAGFGVYALVEYIIKKRRMKHESVWILFHK